MVAIIQQAFMHKEKEIELLQFVFKKIRQIKERKKMKKERQDIADLDIQFSNL